MYGSTVTKEITVIVKGIGGMLDDAITKAKAAITKVYDEDGDIDASGLTDLHQDIKLYTEYEKMTNILNIRMLRLNGVHLIMIF